MMAHSAVQQLVASGGRMAASSSHPTVTEIMLETMRDGGNAVDAAVAASLAQAAIEPAMSNHAGTVTFLYWERATGLAYQLDAMGTLVPDLPAFRPIPAGTTFLSPAHNPPCACIPGFMPGLAAIHERFGTRSWHDLCQPAIAWAEHGHQVSSFELQILVEQAAFNTYFPESRAMFFPGGFMPRVGERLANPALAETLRRLADEGPTYFTTGGWARQFVAEAHRLGWPIALEHMTAITPRWISPLRYRHGEHEIIQLAPPQRTGVFSALTLGVLRHLGIADRGHYAADAESLYLFSHVLRLAEWHMGFLHDPELFGFPVEQWLADTLHRHLAELIAGSMPKIDLTNHVHLTFGTAAGAASGLSGAADQRKQPTGSCELSIVDAQGNWLQMMHTLQSGGIPGAVVAGVNMVGSHAKSDMRNLISGWLTGGGRIKNGIGNTLVLRDGEPWLALGTPGNVHVTVPQVLSNILDYGMEPYQASLQPRMLPLGDDYVLTIESRLPSTVVAGLARLGVYVKPHQAYDWNMGSFQMCWRDNEGMLHSCADPRRAGAAGTA